MSAMKRLATRLWRAVAEYADRQANRSGTPADIEPRWGRLIILPDDDKPTPTTRHVTIGDTETYWDFAGRLVDGSVYPNEVQTIDWTLYPWAHPFMGLDREELRRRLVNEMKDGRVFRIVERTEGGDL